jgi:uncharacterized protein (DUF433 family)
LGDNLDWLPALPLVNFIVETEQGPDDLWLVEVFNRQSYRTIAATRHRYIVRDDQILSGEPIIEGTRTPVRAIVEVYRLGVGDEEIPSRLPHLTVA